VEDLLDERVRRFRDVAERLLRVSVELSRKHNLANTVLEELRYDVGLWLEAAEAEYAAF
jgi:hypothetical protein